MVRSTRGLSRWLRPAKSARQTSRPSEDLEYAAEVVDGREAEEEGVEAVEQAAVARQDGAHVLHPEVALQHGLAQVAERRGDGHDEAEGERAAAVPRMDAERG